MRDFIKTIAQILGCAILGVTVCALVLFIVAICETIMMV